MLRAWLHRLQGLGFSCALRLLQVVQSHLVLRLRFLLELVIFLLLPLLCLACLGNSSVRRIPALVGVVVARPAMGPTDARRRVTGGGLLLLCLLLVVGRGTIGLPRVLLRKTETMLLLPELDMRLEVHLAILALLELMTVRHVLGRHGRLREASVIAQALVVDPLLLRERRMMTGRVPSSR